MKLNRARSHSDGSPILPFVAVVPNACSCCIYCFLSIVLFVASGGVPSVVSVLYVSCWCFLMCVPVLSVWCCF